MSVGVLLCNVGTPAATDEKSIRAYLRQFMSDPRVIDRTGLWWKFLLNTVIIPRRAPKSAAAYMAIWDEGGNESPLRRITRSQAELLQAELPGDGCVHVDWAMRYGKPSIAERIGALLKRGCDRLLVVPLYPQYSGATTGSVMDEVFAALATMQAPPALRVLPPYFADPAYVDAVAQSIRSHHDALGWRPEVTLLSFHGLPQHFIEKGDPYQGQCEETLRCLRSALCLNAETMPLVYQSRGGRTVWIGPDLEETLVQMAGKGVRQVSVVTPGFSSDCVETLEEVAIRANRAFCDAGGKRFSYVPCLNDSPPATAMMRSIVARELSGWIERDE